MKYIKIHWLHNFKDDPEFIYSAINEEGYEEKKIEIFKRGNYIVYSENINSDRLAEGIYPSLKELTFEEETETMQAFEISEIKFKEIWDRYNSKYMEKKAISFELISNDGENLSSVYFEFNDGYFIICRNLEKDDTIYFEMNDQCNSGYSNDCKYIIENSFLILYFSENISSELKCETTLRISYEMSEQEKEHLQCCLEEIFPLVRQ